MATHFTIPINRSPCSGGRYQAMPAGLSTYLSSDEYCASMARIQAANRSAVSTRFLYLLSWLGYMAGLFQLCGLFSYGGYSYDDYYVSGTWVGLSVAVVSFVCLISLSRYMRKRRAAQVQAAVQLEHLTYSTRSPALAWRLIDDSLLEIDVVSHQQQHIAALEHQVHVLQAQMAAQAQHQAVDHELIAHQAAAAQHAQQHHYAPAAAPSGPSSPFHVQYYPTVASPAAVHLPVAEPVYAQAVYQPAAGSVFAHPPPQYYAPQPRTDMRAPLVQHQY